MPEAAEDYLRSVQTSDRVRAAAWDAVYAPDDQDAERRIAALPLSQDVKAKLWDFRAEPDAPPSRAEMSRRSVLPDTIIPADEIRESQQVVDPTGGSFDFEMANSDSAANQALLAVPAMAAGGGVLGALGRSAVPYAAPLARGASAVLSNPVVGAAVGGYYGGVPGAFMGAATGGFPRVGRALSRFANRVNPPAARVNPNAAASERMVRGMSEAGTRPAPATAKADAPAPKATPSAAPSAAPETPAASRPAAPASPAGQAARAGDPGSTLALRSSDRTRGQMSPSWIQSDLSIVAKRAKTTLDDAEYVQAEKLVRQGRSPIEAVAEVKGVQMPATTAAAPAASAPAAPVKPKMSAAELREYTKLRRRGKTHEEATEALEAQKALTGSLGTPTPEQARQAVAERNATSRWGQKRGDTLASMKKTSRKPGKADEATGLPLNDDGTVTVYHHTNADAAKAIRQTGHLQSRGEPDVYVTTEATPTTGYGDTVVAIRVRPKDLIIDDEFPGGRRDFRLPGSKVKVAVDP